MEIMARAQATAAYREFVSFSNEPGEMDFDSWIAWELIQIKA